MDLQGWLKLVGAVAGIATAAGGGAKLGYDTRDAEAASRAREVAAALERSRCKITELKEPAMLCGWVRPEDWCQLAEEQ